MDALAPGHLLVVLLVALIVLGPTELPKVVRGFRRLRGQLAQLRDVLQASVDGLLDEPSVTAPDEQVGVAPRAASGGSPGDGLLPEPGSDAVPARSTATSADSSR